MADMDVTLLKGITQEHCRRTHDHSSRIRAEGAVAVVLEILYNTPQDNPLWASIYRGIAGEYVEVPYWRESPEPSGWDELIPEA